MTTLLYDWVTKIEIIDFLPKIMGNMQSYNLSILFGNFEIEIRKHTPHD